MSKIDSRLTSLPTPAKPGAPSTEPLKAVPSAATSTDRLVVSGAVKTAERLRATSEAIASLLEYRPRTTRQATAWVEKGRALHAEATPSLKNGDLKSLPLKERQEYMINVRRLEGFLEDGPGLIRFFKGE